MITHQFIHRMNEMLSQSHTANKEYYIEVMRESIHQKCTELWNNQSWTLHHDNAPVHISMLVREFLAKKKTIITDNRWLFPLSKTKDTDERKVFCYDWGNKRKIERGVVGDTKKRLSEGFRELEKTLASVYYICGGYFEGDKIVIDK